MPNEVTLSTDTAAQDALDKRKQQQSDAMKAAQEANAKTQARIAELKTYEGKTFVRRDGTMPRQTAKIVRYEGIGRNAEGRLYHMFRVEYKHPGMILTPNAKQFLEDYVEIEAAPETATNEVI